MAGVLPGATQIVPRSVDGWTAGFPTEWVTAEERDALIAVRMNDEPLPVDHGFPARLIVPGLYGYVSATKWLSEIELTTLEAFDAYWVPRGWAKEAPILTQSRIDVPRGRRPVAAGQGAGRGRRLGAGPRASSGVEVSVDDGPWEAAMLATAIGDQTWVQWRFDWSASSGRRHRIAVRATDGTGEVQTAQRTRPDPDGARGITRPCAVTEVAVCRSRPGAATNGRRQHRYRAFPSGSPPPFSLSGERQGDACAARAR